MKRLICFLMCAALILSMSITASADESVSSDQQTASSTITYTADSTFIINIPETIDANTGYTFTASEINLEDDLRVAVYCTTTQNDNTITMTSANGNTFEMMLTGGNGNLVAVFDNDNTESPYIIYGQPAGETPRAGQYTGTAVFQICLEVKPIGG